MSNKNLTGYPSIDKPWLKYHRRIPVRELDLSLSLYEQVYRSNIDNMDEYAIGYMGKEITYSKMFYKIDELSRALLKFGIKAGDVVIISTINTPEAIYLLLALNKIGAISKWIDLRVSKMQLIKYINENNCKLLFIHESLYDIVREIKPQTSLMKTVIITPADSLNPIKKIVYKTTQRIKKQQIKLEDSDMIGFNEFINDTFDTKVETFRGSADLPSLMIQSSGTTGMAKSIVHSNFSVNYAAQKIAYTDLPLQKGYTLFVTIPPWVGYGLINSIYLSLVLSMKAELCPHFEKNSVLDYIEKIDVSFAAPFHYRYLTENLDKISNLTRVKALVSGGDSISESEILEMNNKLFEKGCKAEVLNGYGNNECLGAITVNSYKHNKAGSIGIPMGNDIVAAFDNTTELPFEIKGEICARTDSSFIEYFENPEETAKVKIIHPDGKVWIHTGDIGYMDKNGCVYILGRMRRVIIRNAFKLYPGTMEKVIQEYHAVKECVVVGVDDPIEKHVPMAFIVLQNEYKNKEEEVIGNIKEKCHAELKDNEIPKYFKVIDNIPYTNNNKQDFRELETLGNLLIKEEEN